MQSEKNYKIFFSLLAILFSIAYYVCGNKSFTFNSFDLIKVLSFSLTLLHVPFIFSIFLITTLCLLGFLLPASSTLSFVIFLFTLYGPVKLAVDLLRIKKVPAYYLLLFPLLAFFIYTIWQKGYASPLFFEKILKNLNASDSYYHLAISHIIKERNYPSIGVDGLLYQQYHFGSHIIFAYLSKIFNIHILPFYNLMVPIALIPLFLLSILRLNLKFFNHFESGSESDFKSNLNFENYKFVFFMAFIVGLAPFSLRDRIAYWQSIFISESYLLSMIFALPWFYLTILKSHQKKIDWILIFLLTIFIGTTKVSTLFILMAFLGIFQILTKKIANWKNLTIYLGLTVLSIIIFFNFTPTGNFNPDGSSFDLFSFYKHYVRTKYLPFHFFFFFTPIWMLYFYEGVNSKELKCTFLITLGLSLLPGIFVYLPGGSAYYFFDVANWLAIPLAIESLKNPKILKLLNKKFIFLVLLLTLYPIFKASKELIPFQKSRLSIDAFSDVNPLKKELFQNIYKIDKTNFKNALVYIPRNHLYWSVSECHRTPLIFQALTGIPQLNAQPPKDCLRIAGMYGYINYGLPIDNPDKLSLCNSHANQNIYELQNDGSLVLMCKE